MVLQPGESQEVATNEARRLMDELGIGRDALVPVAYVDLLS